ncbi:Arginyl-tRNA synthetase [Operophtera brumata]|uniref:Probable arginine--tRNA ligase, mitochondrial n=1 Tax=Operophtera brumata TaxID=104452 RepID=A0A0L7LU28_OPEBR|nr:Arginyl-tRNA synthetase [Operophtera brumata]
MKYGLDKILSQTYAKEARVRHIKNIQVSYKHNENRFALIVSGKQSSNNQTLGKGSNEQALDSNSHRELSIGRETFLATVLTQRNDIEQNKQNNPKKIVIDFSSPNIAKPFHVGHLRSTIIGNFIANINKYFDHKVIRLNYLGDWGTQFGLLQYGLKAKNIDVAKLQTNPIKTLYDVYVYANRMSREDESVQQEARKYFSEIEQGTTSLDNWKAIRETTLQELENVYQRLGIHFDEYHWESDYNGGVIKDLMGSLENDGIIRNDESGKKITTVNNRDVTVLKSDNSTLYLSRDIAALLDRYQQFEFDKMLYVVDNGQTDHFSAVFHVVKQINKKCTDCCEHIKFGRIKGMSTRSGNVVFLNDILDEAKQKMHEQQQKDYVFNWDRALQSDGDSGIKLQYLHCRLWSLEQSCGASLPEQCDPHYLPEEVIGDVVAELAKFEHILHKSSEEYEACILVGYLLRLAKHVNRMFNELKVKNVDADLASQRLLVFHTARLVVKTGLEVLGVKPLLEM